MSLSKKEKRVSRAKATRIRISLSGLPRLCVFRSNRYIYAQLISASGSTVIASASSLEKSFKAENVGLSSSGTEAASLVGSIIARKAKEAGISDIAFDRSGYKYHGKVKALADAARSAGLNF